MAVTAQRLIQIALSGDANGTMIYPALANIASVGAQAPVSLASGANTITVPVVAGFLATAVTIIPPAGNTSVLTLKGVTGDTGVALHLTDPSSIALAPTVTTFVLNAVTAVAGVRIVWS